jgi:hypothetical protein
MIWAQEQNQTLLFESKMHELFPAFPGELME